jgi:hypothetical protein
MLALSIPFIHFGKENAKSNTAKTFHLYILSPKLRQLDKMAKM